MVTNISRRSYYSKANDEYADFLKSEYDNIASAHFSAVSEISTFFKHYLFFVGLPVPVGIALLNFLNIKKLPCSLETVHMFVGMLGIILSIIGFFVMCYLSNLRFDVVLYAQKVNSIRRFFSDRSNLELQQLLQINHLPCSKAKPHYNEPSYFGWVVWTIAFINACYLFAGMFYLWSAFFPAQQYLWIAPLFVSSVAFLGLHWAAYLSLSKYRDTRFFKTRIIGVDIDGVLNKHREHFCNILKEKTGKVINPDDITKIPVRNCSGLGISQEDELKVFHDIKYWKEMPADEEAIKNLEKIQKEFGFHIHLFSYRPWPIKGWPKIAKDKTAWRKNTWMWWWHGAAMSRITKCWLKENSFSKHKKFQLEKAHVHVTSSRIDNLTRNRYVLSKSQDIEIFIEDTLENAIKLSMYCDIVFLIDHPYNQTSEIPYNIVRVNNWEEIYDYLKIVV